MHKVCLYLSAWLLLFGGCTRDSDWEMGPADPRVPDRVPLQMAIRGLSLFDTYIHSLAIYAFTRTDEGTFVYHEKVADLNSDDIRALEPYDPGGLGSDNSRILKLTLPVGIYEFYYLANDSSGSFVEPVAGSTGDFGYLPFPAGGIRQAYFMGSVQLKPDTGLDVMLFVVLDRVVCRLTVVLDDLPGTVDTVRYRVSGLASGLSLDHKVAGDTMSVAGVYARVPGGGVATDTVINRLMLFPASGSRAGVRLTFVSGSTVVREEEIQVSGLVTNGDVYVTGRWVSGFTSPARLFSSLFYSSPRSSD